MKPALQPLLTILFSLSCLFPAWAQDAKVRPGKGMDLIPGDFAEYTNTEYVEGKATKLPSTIMMAMGPQGEFEGVVVLGAKGDELSSTQNVLYDLSKEKAKVGELLEEGKGNLTINGKSYDCSWEKRKNVDTVFTFWNCPALPFEKYAKVEVEIKDGKKRITELVYFGPDTSEDAKSREFQKRLQKLVKQAAEKTSR